MFEFTVLRFNFVALLGFSLEILRFLERHLLLVFFGFNRYGVGLALGSFFVAAFPKRATLALLNIKIIGRLLVFTLALLSLASLSNGHVSSWTYVHACIFVEQKFVFFLSCALCNEGI
ncbi:hypothetical protein D3C73_1057390 [compost metagenome]